MAGDMEVEAGALGSSVTERRALVSVWKEMRGGQEAALA